MFFVLRIQVCDLLQGTRAPRGAEQQTLSCINFVYIALHSHPFPTYNSYDLNFILY